jgi:type IV pilus assembly protein PilO
VVIATEQRTGNLTMDAIARTFRYLDDDEVAEQRKAAKKGGKRR